MRPKMYAFCASNGYTYVRVFYLDFVLIAGDLATSVVGPVSNRVADISATVHDLHRHICEGQHNVCVTCYRRNKSLPRLVISLIEQWIRHAKVVRTNWVNIDEYDPKEVDLLVDVLDRWIY
jgi:hypothetical protein